MLKGIRKFGPALALAGALLAAGLPGGSAKAQNVPFSSGFQVQNLESVGANISMAFYDEGGTNPTATVNATIPANDDVTYATLPSQVANGFRGSAVISSDQRIAAIVNLISPGLPNINLGSSYIGVTGGSTTAALPLLFKDLFGINSFFSVQNVGQTAANVTVTYAGEGLSGTVTETATIQPGASARFDQLENDNIPAGWQGSAIITSNGGEIAAVATQYDEVTALTYNGFEGGTTTPSFPLINVQPGLGLVTGLSIQNLGDTDTNVEVTYTNSADGTSCTETKTIAGRDTTIFGLDIFTGTANVTGENCPNGGSFVGSATVTDNSADADLVAIINQVRRQGTTNNAGAYASFDAAAATNTVVFPLIMDRTYGIFTGISVVNVSDVDTTVTCTYSGISTPFTSETLSPGEPYVFVHQNQLRDSYVGSGRCVANAANATIVGIANQVSGATTDTTFTYEGINN